VLLEPHAGVTPSPKPPVRIFVGTEPSQWRAERVLVWSIERVRDPARCYEIHLMKDLAGFDRSRWLTGFTNYRFAIPHLAGRSGRAIYNDVDQIYLVDPAELFDLDMEGHGYLSITPRDTSVMLIDCERMAGHWPLDAARHERRKRIEASTREVAGLWGPLAREWNSRDEEYVAGGSKVLHYTTIHTQPWQPFPERFVYQGNAVGQVWLDLEREAERAGFRVFTASRPSDRYRELIVRLAAVRGNGRAALGRGGGFGEPEGLDGLLTETGATSVLEFRLGRCSEGGPDVPERRGRLVTRYDPAGSHFAKEPERAFDAVVAASGLEFLPDEDIPWVVESLFRYARRCIYLRVDPSRAPLALADGSRIECQPRSAAWWLAQLESAAAQHPAVHWKLCVGPRGAAARTVWMREGGPPPSGHLPRVWVLADDKAGHTTQSLGLADALGWPCEVKQLRFNVLNRLSNGLLGETTRTLDRQRSAPLTPPWPDLVISTGRRCAPVARWIAAESLGRTRLVHLGRKGGERADAFDLVVSCAHFRQPLHPRRLQLVLPLNAVTPERLVEAASRWRTLFEGAPRPHVVLVVGGTSAMHVLDAEAARRMADEVRRFALGLGGSAFAITSPRTGPEATRALTEGLGAAERVHVWRRGETDNPYLGYLARADVLVVTGESESMLAEAAAAGKPLFIYPLPERPPGLRRRLAEWVVSRSEVRPRKEKGTVRPQQGTEYLCARLIERGLVRPPRDLARLHRALIERGVARAFGDPLDDWRGARLAAAEEVAERVRALFGHGAMPAPSPEGPERLEAAAL
jgi:hypothetical protein